MSQGSVLLHISCIGVFLTVRQFTSYRLNHFTFNKGENFKIQAEIE